MHAMSKFQVHILISEDTLSVYFFSPPRVWLPKHQSILSRFKNQKKKTNILPGKHTWKGVSHLWVNKNQKLLKFGSPTSNEKLLLPQANSLPPNPSNSKPDYNIDDRYEESIAPPFGKRDIVGTIENRSWPNAIVGKATHEIREEGEHHGRKVWGSA